MPELSGEFKAPLLSDWYDEHPTIKSVSIPPVDPIFCIICGAEGHTCQTYTHQTTRPTKAEQGEI